MLNDQNLTFDQMGIKNEILKGIYSIDITLPKEV